MTLARNLGRRKAREKAGLFAAEGVRAVEELLRSELSVQGALVTPRAAESDRGRKLVNALQERRIQVEEVSEPEFATAAETDSPQGILAIARIPECPLDTLKTTARVRMVILDGVQDPGNAGTIIRTAAAFGASAVVGMPGTVDLWNAKVVRSAMGAGFHLAVTAASWPELAHFTRERDVSVWTADAAGAALGTLKAPDRLALVVGNEGAGVSAGALAVSDAQVALPIGTAVESLNVAVTTGIFLFELRL